MTNADRRTDLLVKCPDEEGVWWFPYVCEEQKMKGRKPCVACTAPEHPIPAGTVVKDIEMLEDVNRKN